jgi:hypothetical protein
MIAGKVLFETAKLGQPLALGGVGLVSKPLDRPGRGYADVNAYPADPSAAEAEAFGYWKDNGSSLLGFQHAPFGSGKRVL